MEGSNQAARDHDAERKQVNKDYTDKKHRVTDRDVREGDTVLLEQRRENKLSPVCEKESYEVLARYHRGPSCAEIATGSAVQTESAAHQTL